MELINLEIVSVETEAKVVAALRYFPWSSLLKRLTAISKND